MVIISFAQSIPGCCALCRRDTNTAPPYICRIWETIKPAQLSLVLCCCFVYGAWGAWRWLYLKEIYSIHVPRWVLKWLNLITAYGSVSNEPGSVTWLVTKPSIWKLLVGEITLKKITTLWPQNISFRPKINIPSSYFAILMLNCLENTLKLQFDSYVTPVKFLT